MAEPLNPRTAWAAVVRAEAAVAYAYGLAGSRLEPPQQGAARTLYQQHEQARDDALLELVAAGGDPVELPAFFAVPEPVRTPAQAASLLALVETRLAANYADLVAALPPLDRQPALDGVLRATGNALRWGAVPGPWGAQAQES